MLAEIIFKRDPRSVSDVSAPTLIAPTAVLVAVLVRNPRSSLNFAISTGAAGGAVSFLELNDTPDSYTGQGTKLVGVKSDESALEFVLPPPSIAGSYLISGGGVAWIGGGFNFRVSRASYVIGGNVYDSPQTDVTLTAADPTNDRIDVIAVDDTGSVVVITGTPGGPPVQPAINPASQLELTFIYVQAGATDPSVTREDLYQENTEWTSSTNTGNINLASTNNPFAGTKDIEGTNTVNGNFFTLVRPGGTTIVLGNYEVFVMQVRSKAKWPTQKSLQLFWMHGAANVGVAVTLKDGTFGFDSSNTSGYQQIVIPIANFLAGVFQVDTFRATVSGGASAIGWYIDNISIQGGVPHGKGGGDFSTNTNVAVPDEIVLFGDVTGKLGKRATGTGLATVAAGVLVKVSYPGQGGKIAAVKADESGMEFIPAPTPVVSIKRNFVFAFRKSTGLVAGKLPGYWTCPFSGTISAWDLTVDAGTITLKIWKKATGTAKPTAADSINTSGLALSTGTNIHSTSLGDFTTLAVSAGDILAAEITAVSGGVTDFGGSIEITS